MGNHRIDATSVQIRTLTARKRTGHTPFTSRNLPTVLACSLRYRRVEG